MLLLLVLVQLSVRAEAAERASNPSTPLRTNVVLLEAVGNPVDVEALRTSLEDWLRSMQLELHLVGVLPTPSEAAFARVRVVWSDETCVVEVFSGTGLLRRRKALPRGGPPLLVSESAALVAQAGVQELEIEERRKAPSPAPLVAATGVGVPAVTEPPFGLRVGAYFQGRGYDSMSPVLFGGGAQVGASFGDGPWHPGVLLLLGYTGPVTRQASLVDLQVQLQSLSFRLLPSLRRSFGPFELELGLGGGFDVLIATTSSSVVSGPRLRANRVDPAPFFTAELGVSFKLTASTALFLRAVVDLDPARRRYVSTIAGQNEYLLVPWTARPALQLGFSFDVLARRGRAP